MSFSKPQVNVSSNFTSHSRLFSAQIKIHQILVIFERKIGFSPNFTPLFSTMRHNSSLLFKLKFYMLSTKLVYHSAINLVRFHLSSQKSEILHFGWLFLEKLCNVSAKKCRRFISYDAEQ